MSEENNIEYNNESDDNEDKSEKSEKYDKSEKVVKVSKHKKVNNNPPDDITSMSLKEICKLPQRRFGTKPPPPSTKPTPVSYFMDEICVGEVIPHTSIENDASEVSVKRKWNDETKPKKTKKWDKDEILKLYTGIMKYGADFGLIQLMFEDRTRKQIKAKFKAEERIRPKMIEKALNCQQSFSAELFQETLDLINKQQDSNSEESVGLLNNSQNSQK